MQCFLIQWTFPQDFNTFYFSIQIDIASVHLRLDTEKRLAESAMKGVRLKKGRKKHSILKKNNQQPDFDNIKQFFWTIFR